MSKRKRVMLLIGAMAVAVCAAAFGPAGLLAAIPFMIGSVEPTAGEGEPEGTEPADGEEDALAILNDMRGKLDASLARCDELEAKIVGLQEQMQAADQAGAEESAKAMSELNKKLDEATRDAVKQYQQLLNAKASFGTGLPTGAAADKLQSPGEAFTNSKEYKALVERKAGAAEYNGLQVAVPGGLKSWHARLRRMGRKAEYSGIDTASAAAFSAQYSYRWGDLVSAPDLMVSLRDLLNTITVESDLIEWIEETNYHELRTELTAASAPGDLTLAVSNANGFYPGQEITIEEGSNSQTAEVDSVAVGDDGDAGVVTLTAGITGTHTYAIGAEVHSDTFTFTADTNLKPSAKLTYVQRTCSVGTLATTIPLPKRYLQDYPVLRDRIDNRLMYGLMRSETQQILYGSGTGTDLLGLMINPSVLSYLWSSGDAGDTMADAILEGKTLAALGGYLPNAILINPTDLTSIRKLKGSDGHYLVGSAFEDGEVPTLWGVPVVENTAIAQGEALIGDFKRGATLWDREEAMVSIATQHEDHFTRNMVDLLGEERVCFSTELPEAFVKITFDSAPGGSSS